jgi:hypothetical protein
MEDTKHMTFKKLTLFAILLVFIALLSGQGAFADDSRVIFGVD